MATHPDGAAKQLSEYSLPAPASHWNYPSRAVRVFRLLARCHSLPPVAASLTPAARGRRTQLGPHGRRPTGHSPDKAAASRVPAVVLEDGPASPVHVDVRGPRFELSRRKLGRASRHGTARILCGTRVYVLRRAARHRHKFEGSAWYSLSLYMRDVYNHSKSNNWQWQWRWR